MPKAWAASRHWASHGSIGARPGSEPGAGLLGDVVGAHDEAGEPGLRIGGARRDRGRVDDPDRRFHHRPHPDLVIGGDVDEAGRDILELAGPGNLGHQDAVGMGLGRGGEIVEPPLGVQRIDAHDHLARAEAAGRHRRPRPAGAPPPWRRAQPSPRGRGSPHRRAGSSPFPARAHWRRACKARCGADGWSCRRTPVAVGSDCTGKSRAMQAAHQTAPDAGRERRPMGRQPTACPRQIWYRPMQ